MYRMLSSIGVSSGVGVTTSGSSSTTTSRGQLSCSGVSRSSIGSAVRSGRGVRYVAIAGHGSGCSDGSVVVSAVMGTGGRVRSGVSLGKDTEVSPVTGSALAGAGVVDGSPCATGVGFGPSVGLFDSSTVSIVWSSVAFPSASYWRRWWVISNSTAPYSSNSERPPWSGGPQGFCNPPLIPCRQQ